MNLNKQIFYVKIINKNSLKSTGINSIFCKIQKDFIHFGVIN